MASKKVAELESSEVAVFDDDSLLSGGTGLEEASAGDYAIPFLRVLQSMSPQLKKSDGQYIAEAQEGNFFNSVTNKVYDGDTGVLFPVRIKRNISSGFLEKREAVSLVINTIQLN